MEKTNFNLEEEFWKPIIDDDYEYGDIIDLSKLPVNSIQENYEERRLFHNANRKLNDLWRNEIQSLQYKLTYKFEYKCDDEVSHIDIDNTGQLILVSNDDGSVQMYNMMSVLTEDYYESLDSFKYMIQPTFKLTNDSSPIKSVKWYPFDNDLFITAGVNGRLKVWDTSSQENVVTFDLKSSIYSSDFCTSPSKSNLICGLKDCTLRICDLRVGSATQTFQYHTDEVLTVSWKPRDEYQFASGSKDKTVCIWDIRIGNRCLFCLSQKRGVSEDDPNEETLTGTMTSKKYKNLTDEFSYQTEFEKHLQSLQFKSGSLHTHSKFARNISGSHPLFISYSHDGCFLFSSGSDGLLKGWDLSNSARTYKRYGYINNKIPNNLQFSVDHPGGILFHGRSHSWRAFDTISDDVINNIYSENCRQKGLVQIVKWNKHRHELYSISNDGDIRIWKMITNPNYKKFCP